jgi:hypothetical protein
MLLTHATPLQAAAFPPDAWRAPGWPRRRPCSGQLEPLGRRAAAAGLVRPGGVVVRHPRVQRRLQLRQRRVLAIRGPEELRTHRPASRASVSAWQTGRAVARITAFADTTNREWSSIPVTILTSAPPYRQATSVTETPSLEYFLHCPVPLLHRTQLRQHARLPPPRPLMDRSEATGTPESP